MNQKRKLLALLLAVVMTVLLAAPAGAVSAEYEEGYDEGWNSGYDEGAADFEAGKENAQVSEDSFEGGKNDGFRDGYLQGYTEAQAEAAFARGYEQGLLDGKADRAAGTEREPDYGSYDAYDMGYCDGYYDGFYGGDAYEEYDPAKAIAKEITQLGGTPGKINVKVDGKLVNFGTVWPEHKNGCVMVPARAMLEALGAAVTYEAGVMTASLDGAQLRHRIGTNETTVKTAGGEQVYTAAQKSYRKSGSVMVPARFFTQLLGYDTFWDGTYQTVVLLNVQAQAAALDSRMKVLNLLLSDTQNAIGADVNYESSSRCDLKVTLFDTLNGNRSFTAGATGSSLFNRAASQTKVKIDITALMDVIMGMEDASYISSFYGPEYQAQMHELLSKLEIETITDKKTGKVYIKSPLYDTLLGSAGWVVGKMEKEAQMPTAGQLLVQRAMSPQQPYLLEDEYAFIYVQRTPFHHYETIQMDGKQLLSLLGDGKFIRSGSTYTMQADLKALAALLELDEADVRDAGQKNSALDFRLSVTDTGNGTCSYTATLGLRTPEMKLDVDFSKQGLGGRVTAKLHVKNLLEGTFTSSVNTETTTKPVPTKPPAGELVMDLEEATRPTPAL